MSFKPTPFKPIPKREYTKVQFVEEHPEWLWDVPNYFTITEVGKIAQVPYEHCHNYLVRELNKADMEFAPKEPSQRAASQIVNKEAVKSAAMDILVAMGQKNAAKARIIPDQELIDTRINLFLWGVGSNEWSNEVVKDQLDLICKPCEGTPVLSSVFDEADKERMQGAINFFYQSRAGIEEKPKEPTLSGRDFTPKKKNSKQMTAEESTS